MYKRQIIHNEEVVRDLEEKGVVVVNDVDELAGKPQGTVIIRAHEMCIRDSHQTAVSQQM